MNTENTNQPETPAKTGENGAGEPKGQDIMKADAEAAGSEATEFAEGGSNSAAGIQSNSGMSAGNEANIGQP